MPTDATGTPTSLGIPTYNTSVDAPSGLGFNAAMASIDALIAARQLPTATGSNKVPVWTGASWVAQTVPPAAVTPGSAGQVLGMLSGAASWLGGAAKIQDIPALGVASATMDFSSIPTDYRHLMLVVDAQETGVAGLDILGMRFNNDSTSSYSYELGVAAAASMTASEGVTATSGIAGLLVGSSFASGWGSSVIFIPNYTANKRKQWLSLTFANASDATGGFAARFQGGVYRVAAVLNRITLLPTTGNFQTGSTATLYGLGV